MENLVWWRVGFLAPVCFVLLARAACLLYVAVSYLARWIGSRQATQFTFARKADSLCVQRDK